MFIDPKFPSLPVRYRLIRWTSPVASVSEANRSSQLRSVSPCLSPSCLLFCWPVVYYSSESAAPRPLSDRNPQSSATPLACFLLCRCLQSLRSPWKPLIHQQRWLHLDLHSTLSITGGNWVAIVCNSFNLLFSAFISWRRVISPSSLISKVRPRVLVIWLVCRLQQCSWHRIQSCWIVSSVLLQFETRVVVKRSEITEFVLQVTTQYQNAASV